MAEEQEITARLKARLDQWHAYNQHFDPTAAPTPLPVETTAARYTDDPELEPITSAKLLVSPHALVRQQASYVKAEVVAPVDEPRDKHIADLQAAVEYERERNHELSQTVRREQALHYMTLTTEVPERATTPAVPEPPVAPPPMPHYSPELFMEERVTHGRSFARTVPLVVAIVLILAVWALFNFVI